MYQITVIETLFDSGTFCSCASLGLASLRKWHQTVIGKLGELIVTFAVTNTSTKIVLLLVSLPVYPVLGKLVFGTWNRFWGVYRKRLLISFLGPILLFFRRNRDEKPGWYLTNSEIALLFLVDLLWVGLYALEYLLIKSIFLS